MFLITRPVLRPKGVVHKWLTSIGRRGIKVLWRPHWNFSTKKRDDGDESCHLRMSTNLQLTTRCWMWRLDWCQFCWDPETLPEWWRGKNQGRRGWPQYLHQMQRKGKIQNQFQRTVEVSWFDILWSLFSRPKMTKWLK